MCYFDVVVFCNGEWLLCLFGGNGGLFVWNGSLCCLVIKKLFVVGWGVIGRVGFVECCLEFGDCLCSYVLVIW